MNPNPGFFFWGGGGGGGVRGEGGRLGLVPGGYEHESHHVFYI